MAMDLRTRQHGSLGRACRLLFLFLLTLAASELVSAQDIGLENGDNASSDSEITLDRRTKMLLRPREYLSNKASFDSEETGLGIFDAFFASLSMIIVSEIGDETFIIAALMAMRHPKSIVLSGALAALVVMTVLSTGLGRIVPNLISRKHTNSAATAEWGDRSQIATIALATHKNAIGVAVGAILGHTICTSIAVVGGSMLAAKISQRTVATVGGLLFLGFSLSSYFYPPL